MCILEKELSKAVASFAVPRRRVVLKHDENQKGVNLARNAVLTQVTKTAAHTSLETELIGEKRYGCRGGGVTQSEGGSR